MKASTALSLLHVELYRRYIGKTILSSGGVPMKVGDVAILDNGSNDPIWTIHFAPDRAVSPRVVGLDDPLPEIWPDEAPSPCS